MELVHREIPYELTKKIICVANLITNKTNSIILNKLNFPNFNSSILK